MNSILGLQFRSNLVGRESVIWRVTIKLLFIHTIAWWQLTSETSCDYVNKVFKYIICVMVPILHFTLCNIFTKTSSLKNSCNNILKFFLKRSVIRSMKSYKIGYAVAYMVKFVIKRKWFVKYSCTCGMENFFFDNWVVFGRGTSVNCWTHGFE